MPRISAWKHPDGDCATAAALSKISNPWIGALVAGGLDVYPTQDFRAPPCLERLAPLEGYLQELLKNDPRGGHYDNSDLAAGLTVCIEANRLKANVEDIAKRHCRVPSDVVNIMALQVRVMVSHARTRIAQPECCQEKSAKKMRLHPFVAFRKETEEENEKENEDEKKDEEQVENEPAFDSVIISTFFDGKRAWQLMSDGTKRKADRYEPGQGGFITAIFEDGQTGEPTDLQLDIPNSCLGFDGSLKPYLPPTTPLKKSHRGKRGNLNALSLGCKSPRINPERASFSSALRGRAPSKSCRFCKRSCPSPCAMWQRQ